MSSSAIGISSLRLVGFLAAICSAICSVSLMGCSASTNSENRPFFRQEEELGSHGRKTWFDRLVEVDPGGMKTVIAPNYEQVAPERIAVLPFSDQGSAQYVVDKVPLSFRDQQERDNWAWTDGNRMRRAMMGFLAQREFVEANIYQVDAILKEHGIDNEATLEKVPPQTLGQWLAVDAVVYGEVTSYEAYYAGLISAWRVGANVRMVSTHDGTDLFEATGSRYAVNLAPAFDPIDIAIDSALSLLELRDVTLARAEEEDAREIVLRIPRSERLESSLTEEALDAQVEFGDQAVPTAASMPRDGTSTQPVGTSTPQGQLLH